MPDTIVDSAQARLVRALRAREDAARAEREKAYQKSRWDHWGVSLPEMDTAIKETLGDLTQDEALSLCRRLWREPVWDLKIVAGRILARKTIEPDAKVWAFVTQSLADLDGWAVADNLAMAASRCLIADPGRLELRRGLDRKPALVDPARGARLHPALGRRASVTRNGC